jgi:phosphoglycerol transferase MdoB-like AlkP superfamily enzyme
MKLPKEAMGNLSTGMIVLSIIGTVFNLLLAFYFAFKLHPKPKRNRLQWLIHVPLSILILGLSILLSRGGWQVSPINQSFAFYSSKSSLNYAAINSTWNFIFTLLNSQEQANVEAYKVIEMNQLDRTFNGYFKETDYPKKSVESNHPNVVIVMLESFTANLVGFSGAENDCTPNLNKIAAEGIAFSHGYASGNRTDKGLAAVISGFPAQSNSSIITIPTKAKNLPSLIRVFQGMGYKSSFYYGGEPEFANMKAYLLNAGMDQLFSGKDYPSDIPKGKWGVSDEFAFSKLAEDIEQDHGPFVKLMLTISSHEPFDYPNNPGGSSDEKFAAALRYSDKHLGLFWERVKQTPNTLFVFLADHGRAAGLGALDKLPEVNRMPIVLAGTALLDSVRGTLITHPVNQHHLPSNLLSYLGVNSGVEKFSFQNSWTDTNSSIYLTYYNGVGLLQKGKAQLYYNERKTYEELTPGASSDSLGYKARIYQQKVMDEFSKF